jgi:hypothetical protein
MNDDLRPVHRRQWVTRAAVATAAVAATCLLASGPPGRAAAPPMPRLGPAALSATVTDGARPSVSGDGRIVVFEGSVDGRRTVYVTDRQSGSTTELSPVPEGVRSGDTVLPSVSADGCVVVALTEIPFDLFRDDDEDARWDVYRLAQPHCGGQPGAWELVSTRADGIARDDVAGDVAPSVSGSGAVVAYTHPLDGAPDDVMTITVVDLTLPLGTPGRDQSVGGLPTEAPNTVFRYHGFTQPALSANGRHLAFRADATASAPLPGWGTGPVAGDWATPQVYVWDRAAVDPLTAVHLVSGRDGTPSAAGADDPAISEDGRIVAYTSSDHGLADAAYPPCTPACPTQVFRFDRDTDGNGVFDEQPRGFPTALISATDVDGVTGPAAAIAGDQSSWAPAVNVDGSQVAFVTDATNLLVEHVGGGGSVEDGDLLVADAGTGALHRVTSRLSASAVPGAHAHPAMSDTGRVIVFDTVVAGAFTGDSSLTGRQIVASSSPPNLSLAAADFGTVLVGWESAELYVSVLNDGPGAFRPRSVSSSSANFKIKGGSCTRQVVVPAGGTCTVYVVFNPTAPRVFTARIDVAEDGYEAVTVGVDVRGTGGEPALAIDPAGLDFDPVVVGAPGVRRTVDVENVSFAPTSISSIRIVGPDAADFSVVRQACTNRALNPAATCSVEVEFHPIAGHHRTAILSVATPSGSYTAAILSGQGRYEPRLELLAPTVRAGGLLGIGGAGFPASSGIMLRFADTGRVFAIVTSNESGVVLAEVTAPARERGGLRTLVASGPDDATATVDVTVERDTVMPGTPGYGLGG